MPNDLTLLDLAEQVLSWKRDATKQEWGEQLLQLAEDHHSSDAIQHEVYLKTVNALGTYVAGIKASRERQEQADRLMSRALGYNGRPITPTVSVRRDDGSTQTVLWVEATPRQFIDAVLREQKVIDGRDDSNKVRLHVVQLMQEDEQLLDLPSLRDVCAELGIDPDTLDLEELSA